MELPEQLPDIARHALNLLTSAAVQFALAAVIVVGAFYLVLRLAARRRRSRLVQLPDRHIDIARLGEAGPPATGPRLEYHHVPVRLAAVILAPAGRDRTLPSRHKTPELLEAIVPGLARVVEAHKPLICRWPSQLSIQGFVHKVFARVPLPGNGGKGTPWCTAAGMFRFRSQIMLAGLVMRAASDVHFGQRKIEEETKWLDVLRVKEVEN